MTQGQPSTADDEAAASASEAVPSRTLTDWVSYGDAVVVGTVIDDQRIEPNQQVQEHGGYVAREVTIHVDDVLWEHEASTTPLSDRLTFLSSGWIRRHGDETPARIEGATWLDVNHQYVLAIAPRPDSTLAPIGSGAAMPVQDGTAAVAPSAGQPPQAHTQLDGLTPSEIAERVRNTSPDPVAEANRHLSPEERVQAVLDAN